MKKFIGLFAVLLLLFCNLRGNPYMALPFLSLEPSNINRALGGMPIGAANIWHHSALMAYTSPAMPAFGKGIAFGSTTYELPSLSESYVTRYRARMLTLSFLGVGFCLPVPIDDEDNYSLHLDMGEISVSGPNQEFYGYKDLYDTATVWGMAINVTETIRLILPDCLSLLDNVDIALGANYISSRSNMVSKDGASTWNMGVVAKNSYLFDELFELEFVGAFTQFNISKNNLHNGTISRSDLVYGHSNLCSAIGGNLKNKRFLFNRLNALNIISDNLFCIHILGGIIDPYGKDYNTRSMGLEIGLLDTFFYRVGIQNAEDSGIEGTAKGYGINLHYRDLVSLSFNRSIVPSAIMEKDCSSEDINLNLDLIGIWELLN